MDKFLIRKRPAIASVEDGSKPSIRESSSVQGSCSNSSRNCLKFKIEELVSDPGLRPPIADYDVNDQDEVRRVYLQKGACQPRGHLFPWTLFGSRQHRFCEKWFDEYEWLEYSVDKDAAFCLYCYIFPDLTVDPAFVSRGFRSWKEKNRLDNHVGIHSSFHNVARRKCESLKTEKQQIRVCLSNQSEIMKNEYHIRLCASIDCIRFLLKQGLAFRGHNEMDDSANQGNFLELLKFLGEQNEEIGHVVLNNAPENLKLTSPKIQKDIVSAFACETSEEIVKEIGDDVFSILVDESRDVSTKEQMAVVLRYVDIKGSIIERFVGIVHVSCTSAVSLKVGIDDLFCKFGLSISKLRGQGYDGASNMKGEFSGLKTLIMRENPSAYYIHCFAHQIQLILVAVAVDHAEVASFFDTVNMIMNCVGGSCKRYDTLRAKEVERVAKELELCNIETGRGQNQALGIKRAASTRWSSHYDTLCNLCIMFSSVVEVLRIQKTEGKSMETRGAATKYVNFIQTFDFAFMLIFMRNLLGITSELSDAMQRKNQDIVNAMHLVALCKMRLIDFRIEDLSWDSFLGEVCSFCEKNSIDIVEMNESFVEPGRLRRRQEDKTNLHHFRFDIFNTVIDLLLNELNDRFNETNTELLICVACLDPRDTFAAFDKAKLIRLAQFYPQDFSILDVDKLGRQLDSYYVDVRQNPGFHNVNGISGLYEKLVELRFDQIYVLVSRLIKLTLLLPVATASVERVFSAMNIIKSHLRNRVGDEFMNDCLLTYIERDITKDIDKKTVMERFQNMRPTRGSL